MTTLLNYGTGRQAITARLAALCHERQTLDLSMPRDALKARLATIEAEMTQLNNALRLAKSGARRYGDIPERLREERGYSTNAKLTEDQVRMIRSVAEMTPDLVTMLSTNFGCSKKTIRNVYSGFTYKHVKEETCGEATAAPERVQAMD